MKIHNINKILSLIYSSTLSRACAWRIHIGLRESDYGGRWCRHIRIILKALGGEWKKVYGCEESWGIKVLREPREVRTVREATLRWHSNELQLISIEIFCLFLLLISIGICPSGER